MKGRKESLSERPSGEKTKGAAVKALKSIMMLMKFSKDEEKSKGLIVKPSLHVTLQVSAPPPPPVQKAEKIVATNIHNANRIAELSALDMPRYRERKAFYDILFDELPHNYGKEISIHARALESCDSNNLVYGEILYISFFATLEKIRNKYDGLQTAGSGVFYDLGSGIGKAVIAAATIFPFAHCIGIEYLDSLVVASQKVKERFDDLVKHKLQALTKAADYESTSVKFLCADIADLKAFDWSDGDVIFANSTCFDSSLMSALAEAATALRKGAFFITLTKSLPSSEFEVCESMIYRMSWGAATVYIHRKLSDPSTSLQKLHG